MKNLLQIFLFFFLFSAFSFFQANAQHLFAIVQNNLSKEKVEHFKNQISHSDISALSLTRNNEEKSVYSLSLSSVENTRIIVFNEQTGSHVTIIPVEETRNIFQLAPFFIEELKQGTLGNAEHYYIAETQLIASLPDEYLIKNIVSVPVPNDDVYIPQFFYGNKENVKEALPKDRQIVHIFKQKPRLILASEDPELLNYAAQYEEEMNYYVYLYKLPDGTLCTYDEHFNPVSKETTVKTNTRGKLDFDLTGNINDTQRTATEYALALWSDKLGGTVPVRITVDTKKITGNVIGQSYTMQMVLNSGQVTTCPTNTWYPGTLWNQLVGYAHCSGINIKLEMNSNMSFFYGTTGNPSYSQLDWVTVMLHEVNHGLGFAANIQSDGRYFAVTAQSGSYGIYTDSPGIFDRQLFQGTSGPCLTELTQTEREALIKSNNLYSGAPESYLLAAHNGNRVKMYAPTSYNPGSSVAHWNTNPGFTTFMEWAIGNGWKWHTITTREMGILKDMGWTEPNLNAVYVKFFSNGGTGTMYSQEFIKEVEQKLNKNTYKRDGYSFSEWTTNQNGTGDSYQDEQVITIDANMNLYAQWNANTYTLTFNPSSGTVDITSIEVIYDKPVGELPLPVRAGYTFQGWRIGSTDIDEKYIWKSTKNETATAKWSMNTFSITPSATLGGKISPSNKSTIQEGKDKTFTITPNTNFWILDVLVDDISVGPVSEYIFENVTADHTIHAIFTDVGINENYSELVKISPNPTNGQLSIVNCQLPINSVEIFDVFGRKVYEEKENITVLRSYDLTVFPAGIYFVKILTDKGIVSKKIIKY